MTADRARMEELLLLAQELKTRQGEDPLKNFPLHERQNDFVRSTLEQRFKENWFIAANRSGKSEAGAYVGATLARFGRQDARYVGASGSNVSVRDRATAGWVSALDFPTSRDVIQPKYFDNGYGRAGKYPPFIPNHEIEAWDKEAQVLKLKNGSIIGFKSAESGRRKYQGADRDWMHMDEEHPFEIYEECVIRVGQKPLIFFCTCTLLPPEGQQQTVSWVFPKLITPWKEGKLHHVGLYGASIYDNPGIPREEIKRLEAIYPEGTPARRIRLEGEWLPGMGGALAYASFSRLMHVKPQPPVSQRRPLVWAWDFNVEPMVGVIGQVDGDVYRVHKEIFLEQGNIPEACDTFIDLVPEHGAEIWLYGDATGKGRTGQTGKSDYWMIMNHMKQYGAPIRLRVPEENPRVPDRINAVNAIMKDEHGHLRVSIDPKCTNLILDLEGVLRDNKGGVVKITNKKDPYFWRTHISDAFGYWLAFEEPVRPNNGRASSNYAPKSLSGPQYGFGRRR